MDRFNQARRLVEMGFHLFPCLPNDKRPAVTGWQDKATRDMSLIEDWFLHHDYNIGITTSRFADDKALVVVDVDDKGDKRGSDELIRLELEGYELPCTFEQATPSGGKHLIYVADKACKQGVNVLGAGLDIRSNGGYIVGPGSEIDGKQYAQINGHGTLTTAPDWLVHRLGQAVRVERNAGVQLDGVDSGRAIARAIDFLKTAPVAIEGQGGDHTTFKVICKIKDLGVAELDAMEVLDIWNQQCVPPWSADELNQKIINAYRYGTEPVGAAAPEAIFEAAPRSKEVADEGKHPFDKLNDEYAYILSGGTGSILWETTDQNGQFVFQLMNVETFHQKLAPIKMQVGDKPVPVSKLWMSWEDRRSYDGLTFMPGQDAGSRWYNMWRGFTVQPADTPDHPMVERWKEHLLENVCQGNSQLAHWLTSWFAQLIQRPWEKPLVALCFRGSKGTGKNALVERVSKLLGCHAQVTSRRRYLVSNFTSHLQKCLLFVLDEAFWSGDKEAEGIVKDLITGSTHDIELKGKDPYQVKNLTRVVVIGNEEWLVPATEDERRWAVFDIGEGRKQDRQYFEEMRKGLDDHGGNAHLLRYLLDYKGCDINAAPDTEALVDQKHASLDIDAQWWFACLQEGRIVEGDFGGDWPERIPTNRMYQSYERYCKKRNVRGRFLSEQQFSRRLHRYAPTMQKRSARVDNPEDNSRSYFNPGLEALRKDWESFIKGNVNWEQL